MGRRGGTLPVAVGALLPDIVDIGLARVLRATPSRHGIGHSAFAAAGFTVIAARLGGGSGALSFGSAYLLHLVGDDVHHGRVPWLLPLSSRKRAPHRRGLARLAVWGIGVALELPALLVLWRLLIPQEKMTPAWPGKR